MFWAISRSKSHRNPVGRFHPNKLLTCCNAMQCNGYQNKNENNFKLDEKPPSESIIFTFCVPCISSGLVHSTTPLSFNRQNYTWNNLQCNLPIDAAHYNSKRSSANVDPQRMATCKGCGKMNFISKIRRSKRFCSTAWFQKYK